MDNKQKSTGPTIPTEAKPTKSKRRVWMIRLTLVLGSGLISLVIAEVALRWMLPADSFVRGREWTVWRANSDLAKQAFVADSELGFHPRIGTSHYDANGSLILGRKPAGKDDPGSRSRILLLGDSVTARRSIEDALRKTFGDEDFRFWNCGVGGYNTYQEIKYYQRFCRPIRPDHVILTLHHNDYESTPVAFYDDQGRIAVFSPDRPSTGLNPWLFQYSYMYRMWFSWKVSQQGKHDHESGAASIRESLVELRDLLKDDGIRLSVLVLPPCRTDEWKALEKRRHQRSLKILDDLKISHFDLAPGLKAAIDAKVQVQETKGDTLHPSPAAAEYFVQHICKEGFKL
jgi:hypothetical protein